MKDWRLNGRARHTLGVMAGHSRPKDGVLSHAMSRPSTSLLLQGHKEWMPGTRPGMTMRGSAYSAVGRAETKLFEN
jgi:hypothetical protein